MEITTTFRLGGEETDNRLERARACAEQLSAIECSWHKKCPRVAVDMDNQGELKWAVRDVCCDGFKQEIVKAIEEVTPQL